jgi:hypothetical protein
MFQDIKVSDDLNTEFLEYLKSESSSNQTMTHLIGLDFNIYVLQVKPKTKVFFVSFISNLSFRPIHGQLLNP